MKYIFFYNYLKPQRYGKDNSPDGHEDESSHEHQPPAKALNQQVLQQTNRNRIQVLLKLNHVPFDITYNQNCAVIFEQSGGFVCIEKVESPSM